MRIHICVHHAAAATATLAQEVPTGKQKVRKYENGFQIEDLAMGQPDGPLAKPGQKVFVKYRGTLTNGKVFDETKGKSTFGFRLGKRSTPALKMLVKQQSRPKSTTSSQMGLHSFVALPL